jgi:hypothetical protein
MKDLKVWISRSIKNLPPSTAERETKLGYFY